jgi:septal ring factor EnvC (AmiA/AmiB activator)
MTQHHPYPYTDLQEVAHRNNIAAQLLAALTRNPLPLLPVWAHVIAALDDIETLIDEVTGLRAELASIRYQRANLLAAIRATLAADRDGDDDPLYYVRDELQAQTHADQTAGGCR